MIFGDEQQAKTRLAVHFYIHGAVVPTFRECFLVMQCVNVHCERQKQLENTHAASDTNTNATRSSTRCSVLVVVLVVFSLLWAVCSLCESMSLMLEGEWKTKLNDISGQMRAVIHSQSWHFCFHVCTHYLKGHAAVLSTLFPVHLRSTRWKTLCEHKKMDELVVSSQKSNRETQRTHALRLTSKSVLFQRLCKNQSPQKGDSWRHQRANLFLQVGLV